MEIFKGRDLSPPSVPTLKVEIPAMTLTIEHDKKISLTAIVLIVLEIARILLKQILEQINEMLVEEYCGKRYERGNSRTTLRLIVYSLKILVRWLYG